MNERRKEEKREKVLINRRMEKEEKEREKEAEGDTGGQGGRE